MYNTYNSVELKYVNGASGALSNICHGNGIVKTYSSVMDLLDAVEDSKSPVELLQNLQKLKLVGIYNLSIDRDTTTYTRIKGSDTLGNVKYLIVKKN